MNCPTCDGETYDNRKKVAEGWKGPLYKCKDKNCAWVQWPPKDGPKAMPARAAKWTWAQLAKTYERSLLVAEMRVQESAARLKLTFTMDDVLDATSTVFIAATRDGVAEPTVKLPPKPKPPEPQDSEPEPEDDGVPF